jgi:hypothetical protein
LRNLLQLAFVLGAAYGSLHAQQEHDHPAPEKLGKVDFQISCSPAAQKDFNRGVALLHSFAYAAARSTFQQIANEDPDCSMAHWGVAMTSFHQLWEPPFAAGTQPLAEQEIAAAKRIGAATPREQASPRELAYIQAFSQLFENPGTPFSARNARYEQAMRDLAGQNKADVEAQVFYALALLSNAPPTDKTHARQKQALLILEPLDRAYPDHPGITHYIIHACDSSELAPRGLAAARKYAQIAPSAPHALHMPSHIFTRLGLWEDSIDSNLAATKAARQQHDIGEQLHSMDYLVYAYLQLGRYDDAHHVVAQLSSMTSLGMTDFKVGYAATAMPVRYAVERQRWDEAAKIEPAPGSPPQVAAIAVWARALAKTRGQPRSDVSGEISELRAYEQQVDHTGNAYWSLQIRILREEVLAWSAQANRKPQAAESQLRAAADEEDDMEKLPVTPGPIVPAREQLGQLLLVQHQPARAVTAFKASLANAPGRKGASDGLAQAAGQVAMH